jgi:hypothetical protein
MAAPTTPNYPTSNPALSEVITDSTPATPEFHANIHDQIALEVNEIGADLIAAKGGIGAGSMTSKIAAMDASIAAAALKASNLSDLASASTARTNLGLGGAAVLNVGTTAGTVAAGNDARFGSGGSVVGASPYVYVVSSTATLAQQAAADYLCDGTNDEVTIQTAIKYAGDNGINHIKLSSGTFNIDALDVINLAGPDTSGTTFYRSMRFEGTGAPYGTNGSTSYGTVLKYNVASVPSTKQAVMSVRPFTSDPGTSRTRHRYQINNIAIDGNGYGNVIGIKMQWVNIFYLSDINIVGCRGFGLYMNGVSDGTVERLRFNSCGTANAISTASSTAATMISDNIAAWTSDNIAFRDCTWENGMERMLSVISQDPDSTLRGGTYTNQQALYNIQFERCKFEATYTGGGPTNALIQVEGVLGFYMNNCYFYGGSPTSSFGTPTLPVTAATNKPNAYIWLKSTYNASITNSFFSNTSSLSSSPEPSTVYGIYIDNSVAAAGLGSVAQGTTVENNEFTGANTWRSKSIGWITGGGNMINASNSGNWGRDLYLYTFTIPSTAVVAGDIFTTGSGNYTVVTSGTVTSLVTASTSGTPAGTGSLVRVTTSGSGATPISYTAVSAGVTPVSVESKTGAGLLVARPAAQT